MENFFCGICYAFCFAKCFRFSDSKFPSNAKSIGPWEGKSGAHIDAEIQWRRASEYFTEKLSEEERHKGVQVKLFEDDIEPKDVAQGGLGDCWLIAALACVAEHPALVRKAFMTKSATRTGKYKASGCFLLSW